MASVRIIRPPVCIDENVPRSEWELLLEARRRFCESELPNDCRSLLLFVQDAQRNAWYGFPDRESYIREGLILDPEMVEWALDGLQRTRPDVAVKFQSAVILGKHGGKRGEAEQAGITSLGKRNDSAYALARLRRDRPDLAEEVVAGSLSAHAAAVKAGFRKSTWSAPSDIGALALAINRRYPGWVLVQEINQ